MMLEQDRTDTVFWVTLGVLLTVMVGWFTFIVLVATADPADAPAPTFEVHDGDRVTLTP